MSNISIVPPWSDCEGKDLKVHTLVEQACFNLFYPVCLSTVFYPDTTDCYSLYHALLNALLFDTSQSF